MANRMIIASGTSAILFNYRRLVLDQDSMRLMARLAILEFMVAHLVTEHYQGSGYTLDQVKSFNDGLRLQLREGAFGVSDPAMSDAWSAELEAAADRNLSGVEDWMAKDENS